MTMSNKLFPIEHIRPSLKRKGGRTAAVAKYDSSDNNVEGALAVFSSSSLVSAPSMEAHVAKEPSGYKNNASAKIVSSNRRYSLHEIIPPSIASARIFLPSNLCNRVFKCSIKGFCNYLMGLRPTEAATVLTELGTFLFSSLAPTVPNYRGLILRLSDVLYHLILEMERLVHGSPHLKALRDEAVNRLRQPSSHFPLFSAYLKLELQLLTIKDVMDEIYKEADTQGSMEAGRTIVFNTDKEEAVSEEATNTTTILAFRTDHDVEVLGGVINELGQIFCLRKLLCTNTPSSVVTALDEQVMKLHDAENVPVGDDIETELKVSWFEELVRVWFFKHIPKILSCDTYNQV